MQSTAQVHETALGREALKQPLSSPGLFCGSDEQDLMLASPKCTPVAFELYMCAPGLVSFGPQCSCVSVCMHTCARVYFFCVGNNQNVGE